MKTIFYFMLVGVLAFAAWTHFSGKQNADTSPPTAGTYQTYFLQPQSANTPTVYHGDSGLLHYAQSPAPQDEVIVIEPAPEKGNLVDWASWLWRNWQNFAAVLLALFVALEPIVRWTPTEKDNNLLRVVQSWLDRIMPNSRKGGGTFSAYSKPDDAPTFGYVPPKKE